MGTAVGRDGVGINICGVKREWGQVVVSLYKKTHSNTGNESALGHHNNSIHMHK